jgi:hypothetical protein
MQTSSAPAVFKQIRFILSPLFVGTLIGVLAGGGAVLLLKFLPGNYTVKQQTLAFAGFTLLFAFAGFIDMVKCLFAYLRFRKSRVHRKRALQLR